jgi:hypothetical protein
VGSALPSGKILFIRVGILGKKKMASNWNQYIWLTLGHQSVLSRLAF